MKKLVRLALIVFVACGVFAYLNANHCTVGCDQACDEGNILYSAAWRKCLQDCYADCFQAE